MKKFRERRKTVGYIAYRTIQAAVLLYFLWEVYMQWTAGRPRGNLLVYFLLLAAPGKIYAHFEERAALEKEERRTYDKMILRSIVLGILIVAVFVAVAAWFAIKY